MAVYAVGLVTVLIIVIGTLIFGDPLPDPFRYALGAWVLFWLIVAWVAVRRWQRSVRKSDASEQADKTPREAPRARLSR